MLTVVLGGVQSKQRVHTNMGADIKDTITAYTGIDLSDFELLPDDERRAVEGTVFDALWHIADAPGPITPEQAETLITQLHHSVGGLVLLHVS